MVGVGYICWSQETSGPSKINEIQPWLSSLLVCGPSKCSIGKCITGLSALSKDLNPKFARITRQLDVACALVTKSLSFASEIPRICWWSRLFCVPRISDQCKNLGWLTQVLVLHERSWIRDPRPSSLGISDKYIYLEFVQGFYFPATTQRWSGPLYVSRNLLKLLPSTTVLQSIWSVHTMVIAKSSDDEG